MKTRDNTQRSYPQDMCIHHLFEEQVRESPDAIAIEQEESQLSYRELNCRANQLAHFLRRAGVGPEVRVGICIERSPEMLVALLGILKAGGSYVPIDPGYPQQRVELMVKEAQLDIILTQERWRAGLANHGAQLILMDRDWRQIAEESEQNPEVKLDGENLVYTIYTSGSTGRPKGVEVRHRALLNYINYAVREMEVTAADRFLQFASLSFDTAVEEIFVTLTSGARLVLRNDAMLSSVQKFLETCEQWGVTILDPPTAYWHEMVAQMAARNLSLPESLRLMYVGGEGALDERVKQWRELVKEVKLYNGYGPTETTIVALMEELSKESNGEVTIGRPVANTSAYILDEKMKPVPVGVTGELYIGGEGLARGYLKQPDLAADKFIPDAFGTQSGGRLYRTGDLVRHRSDGKIEYLGRADGQVKLRGYRVELREVEAALLGHGGVKEAAVVVREEGSEKQLVGYVVGADGSVKAVELRAYLKQRLPVYMIPSTFVFLPALPLTSHGKVDRKALLALDLPLPASELAYVRPRTALEKAITNIWGAVLQIDKLGMNDNFFDLGGTSLTLIQVRSKVRETLNKEIPLIELFEYPTISELARHLSQKAGRQPFFEQIQDRVIKQKEALERQRQFALSR
ncbi:MAG: non-ribosomal peptide synthetase [Pyrinomonadaceae bacterium]